MVLMISHYLPGFTASSAQETKAETLGEPGKLLRPREEGDVPAERYHRDKALRRQDRRRGLVGEREEEETVVRQSRQDSILPVRGDACGRLLLHVRLEALLGSTASDEQCELQPGHRLHLAE